MRDGEGRASWWEPSRSSRYTKHREGRAGGHHGEDAVECSLRVRLTQWSLSPARRFGSRGGATVGGPSGPQAREANSQDCSSIIRS